MSRPNPFKPPPRAGVLLLLLLVGVSDIKTFLMMGRPGAGKGTQAKLLAKKIGADIYSSGNRLREMAKGQGFAAGKVKETMARGDLLPAWFSSFLFIQELLSHEPQDAVVFEGACRMEEEACDFDKVAAWLERPYCAIFLNISDAEVEKRLALRKQAEDRADDASDSVVERLREYEQKTARAVEFFRSHNALLEINGEQSVEAVHADVLKALNIQ
jgi:adenylate kinase